MSHKLTRRQALKSLGLTLGAAAVGLDAFARNAGRSLPWVT